MSRPKSKRSRARKPKKNEGTAETPRARIAAAKAKLAAARATRKERAAAAKAECAADRMATREHGKVARVAQLAIIRRETAEGRAAAREACGVRKAAVGGAVKDARAELAAEKRAAAVARLERRRLSMSAFLAEARKLVVRWEVREGAMRGDAAALKKLPPIEASAIRRDDPPVVYAIQGGKIDELRKRALLFASAEERAEATEVVEGLRALRTPPRMLTARHRAQIAALHERLAPRSNPEGERLFAQLSPAEKEKAKRAAIADYEAKHWGARGRASVKGARVPDPRRGVLVKMGTLFSVTYEATKKGDPPRSLYEHQFSSPLPELAYSDEGLFIVGGEYSVSDRGILD
jgi:hypothetical protein